LIFLALLACHPAPPVSPEPLHTADTAARVPSCEAPAPTSWDTRPLAHPGEEFAFDAEGNFVTVSDSDGGAWSMSPDGSWTLIAPYESSEIAGVDFQADGTLVIADEGNGSLVRLGSNGAVSLLVGSIASPNSVAVHPSGQIYTTAFDAILRVDPLSGQSNSLVRLPGQDLDGLAFSPDGSSLYFNADSQGGLHALDLATGVDRDVDELRIIGNNELDGMTTDSCGNLYVLRTDGRISLVSAEGVTTGRIIKLPASYASALHFGSGLGGWERDHLYVMDRFGTLFDINIGIEGTQEPHLPD